MLLAESFTKAWNKHDVQASVALFHPDSTLTNPVFANSFSGEVLRGCLEAQQTVFPGINAVVMDEKLAGSNTIGGRYRVSGT